MVVVIKLVDDGGVTIVMCCYRTVVCNIVNYKVIEYLFQERLDHLMHLWELLLMQSAEKGRMLLFTQKRIHFIRECSEVLMWIADRVSYIPHHVCKK